MAILENLLVLRSNYIIMVQWKLVSRRNHTKVGVLNFFDYVDLDKIGLIELWGYAEEVGCTEKAKFRFWHKFGKTLNIGRYLDNDETVLDIMNHIPRNFEVEIYIEHVDCVTINQIDATVGLEKTGLDLVISGSQSEDDISSNNDEDTDEFCESEFDFEEDDQLFDNFVDTSIQISEKENLGTREDISIELLSRMQQDEGDDDCANSGDMGSATDSEDDDSNRFLAYDPNVDSKNPDLKLGMIFSSKKEAKFAIESHCIRRGMMIKFVKNDKSRL
ncbi:uncharacterized protein [Henckelia pumila]|uniref:uncharacterized protein isoform X1 n=1 Tax=Henckelia pumila TaxID=405737 RepID=UPI003C6E884D